MDWDAPWMREYINIKDDRFRQRGVYDYEKKNTITDPFRDHSLRFSGSTYRM